MKSEISLLIWKYTRKAYFFFYSSEFLPPFCKNWLTLSLTSISTCFKSSEKDLVLPSISHFYKLRVISFPILKFWRFSCSFLYWQSLMTDYLKISRKVPVRVIGGYQQIPCQGIFLMQQFKPIIRVKIFSFELF